MLKQIDGSYAVGEAVALCRPQVISCYPITPQTHIVESLGKLVKARKIENCSFMNMESEFGAMSACIGASSAGSRTYTATSSQGMLFMLEAVYNASGMGLPIVMTVGNRAIGSPINIWNDHSDAMSARDTGWIQLFVENNQQSIDVHIQAFKLAEATGLPVMVNMDGFILTHAYVRVDIPTQEQVDQFLPPFAPLQKLDPKAPITMGALVGPEAFTEVRMMAHSRMERALKLIPEQAEEFANIFGRDAGGLVKKHYEGQADTVLVTMGSVIGTAKEVINARREIGESIGAVTLRTYRPFPTAAFREAVAGAKRVVVLDKSFVPGVGGTVYQDVFTALNGTGIEVQSVIAGLGGRPITRKSIQALFDGCDSRKGFEVLDLNTDTMARELAREDAVLGAREECL
ncbi:pyruvate ferredoxin oxidoreductase [Parendozoicomonas haliclonae]|uniref:Pyruvate synthase subunit PorA n=1 Tax=Parendozoicomonas haliclonae TaxID=1960125 RepID=A0A1X7ANY9_9GAMM|nr:pyruvate ferredoxin oxidoreductase [Parendozoicomonas haliclonae]SMA49810.1 Pyruvate synthase subunit PorA [Parendozoicomonas haliclonae]